MGLNEMIEETDKIIEEQLDNYKDLVKKAELFRKKFKKMEEDIKELKNNNLILKFKKLHIDAVIPERAYEGDAGYDLVAITEPDIVKDESGILYIQYRTGLSVQPPKGFRTEIYPRSSISKYNLSLCNSIGLCDNSYRGEIICRFNLIMEEKGCKDGLKNFMVKPKIYKKGDKIAQLVIKKDYIFEVEEVDELDSTERGAGNFGSTDKK